MSNFPPQPQVDQGHSQPDNFLLNTPQAATRLSVTESASRNKDRLLEGTQWISDSVGSLWTKAGVGVLLALPERMGTGVTLERMLASFAGGILEAIASWGEV